MGTLVRLIWDHESPAVRREAVNVLADYRAFGLLEHLDRILTAHDDEFVLDEALDVLASLGDPVADERIATRGTYVPEPNDPPRSAGAPRGCTGAHG